jgi:hypothetical protein
MHAEERCPPIEKWRPDQRDRFLAELKRLEKQNKAQQSDNVKARARTS